MDRFHLRGVDPNFLVGIVLVQENDAVTLPFVLLYDPGPVVEFHYTIAIALRGNVETDYDGFA